MNKGANIQTASEQRLLAISASRSAGAMPGPSGLKPVQKCVLNIAKGINNRKANKPKHSSARARPPRYDLIPLLLRAAMLVVFSLHDFESLSGFQRLFPP